MVCTCPACAEAAAREEAEEEGTAAAAGAEEEEMETEERTDPKLLLRDPAAAAEQEEAAPSLESKEKRRLLLLLSPADAAARFDALLLMLDWIGLDRGEAKDNDSNTINSIPVSISIQSIPIQSPGKTAKPKRERQYPGRDEE